MSFLAVLTPQSSSVHSAWFTGIVVLWQKSRCASAKIVVICFGPVPEKRLYGGRVVCMGLADRRVSRTPLRSLSNYTGLTKASLSRSRGWVCPSSLSRKAGML